MNPLTNINSELKKLWMLPLAYIFVQFNALYSVFFVCSAWKKVSPNCISLWFLPLQIFPNMITSAIFNVLKINSNSSSLMPSLLFVFEVNVDYVEGNSTMIIYNNYVEVAQLCMAKKRSAQLVFHLQPLYLF